MHDVCGSGRRRRRCDNRRHGQRWPASSSSGRFLGRTRIAMWLLHAWNDHVFASTSVAQRLAERSRDSRSAWRKPLPVYGVSEHCESCPVRLTQAATRAESGCRRLAMTQRYVGRAMKRKEDPRLVSGTSTYVDDVVLPGMLHMAVTRSIHAHARIKRVDTSKAQKLPGVVAVVTGEEVAAHCGLIPCAASLPNMKNAQRQLLAVNKVRFVGEPVAAVVAESKYIARDAADLIEIDYEPLPVVVDPEKAMDPASPRLYEEFSDNIAFNFFFESGNTEEAFKKADVIVKERLINQRLAPVTMEPRGVVAAYRIPDNELVVWCSTH